MSLYYATNQIICVGQYLESIGQYFPQAGIYSETQPKTGTLHRDMNEATPRLFV